MEEASDSLVTIDLQNGEIDLPGAFEESIDAIAFAPSCGDGERDRPWEACDDGNAVDDASCSADCTVPEPGRLVLAVVGVLVLLGARRASSVVAAGG
jgi:cysteine-rich repeat protein